MSKWDRLCSRHRWVPVVIMTLLWAVLLWLGAMEVWSWWILIPVTVCMAVSLLGGSAATLRLVNTATKVLQDACDPHPLLEETSYQLGYVKNRSDRTALTINRAAGLVAAGYCHQALEELEVWDIHDPAVTTAWRHIYYHNLTVAAIECGYTEKALVYYQNAIRQFEGLKGKARTEAYPYRVQLSALVCAMQGNYAQAYELLAPLAPPTLYAQVGRAFTLARIAAAQGQPEIARIHLDFAARYGNRLHTAAKARKMLEEMNAQAPSE